MKRSILLAIITSFISMTCNLSPLSMNNDQNHESTTPNSSIEKKYHDEFIATVLAIGSDSKIYKYFRYPGQWYLVANQTATRVAGNPWGGEQWMINGGKIYYHPNAMGYDWVQYPYQLPNNAVAVDISEGMDLEHNHHLICAVGSYGTLYTTEYNRDNNFHEWTKITSVSNVAKVDVDGVNHIYGVQP